MWQVRIGRHFPTICRPLRGLRFLPDMRETVPGSAIFGLRASVSGPRWPQRTLSRHRPVFPGPSKPGEADRGSCSGTIDKRDGPAVATASVKLDIGTAYQNKAGGNHYFLYQVAGKRKAISLKAWNRREAVAKVEGRCIRTRPQRLGRI